MKIKSIILTGMFAVAGSVTFINTASSYMPATPAATVTATCNDGTAFSGLNKKGACSGHKGVKEWTTASAPAAAAPAAAGAKPSAASIVQAAGGGAGKVWVNSKSKVYHCEGTEWYGKTKEGSYMTEADAKAAGNHADHGKACSK